MSRIEDLVLMLPDATVVSPGPGHVGVHRISMSREVRTSLFQHPNSEIRFPPLRLAAGARLETACGIKESCWDRIASPVRFDISISIGGGPAETLHRSELDPVDRPGDRSWIDIGLDLSRYEGQEVELTFRTRTPRWRSRAYCWAGWSRPQVRHDANRRTRSVVEDAHPHVFLITADALRRDMLGCYGSKDVRTPRLDRLASEGVLFEHARGQSPCTLGSYGSLLTSRFPQEHGILAEWGRLSSGISSLPATLRESGFVTMVSGSEGELFEEDLGIASLFEHQVRPLGVPGQEGGITTARTARWLESRPDRPCFGWIQYFDAHPPGVPPRSFARSYYPHDPRDESRRDRPELLDEIRGDESVAVLSMALPLLERGVPDGAVLHRLRDTARKLEGCREAGPDLASHLSALGREARNGLSRRRFARWIGKRVLELESGTVSKELTTWIRNLLVHLRVIEREALSWFGGVVDARYPESMYRASVAYLDHQVGALLDALEEIGIYDQSTIIFLSPHGESLGEQDIVFHHYALLESCLRVPAIIKPGRSVPFQPGSRIDGVFDLIDVFPTLVDGLGLPVPPDLKGVSRMNSIRTGEPVPAHDSFSLGPHGLMAGLHRGASKLLLALEPHRVSSSWEWKEGERRLMDPEDRPYDHPELSAAMLETLDGWISGPAASPSGRHPSK